MLGLTVGQMVGFDVRYWMKCLQVKSLVMLGRFSEADERLARLFQAEQADAEPLHQGIPHFFAVELAWFRNDTLAATRHANQLRAWPPRRKTRTGSWSRVTARVWQPRPRETSWRPTDFSDRRWMRPAAARRDWSSRPEYWHSKPTIECAPAIRNAPVRLPRRRLAWRRRKADRLAECHASLVAAEACLARSGPQDAREALSLLDRANALVDETGAKAYEPMMLRVRTEAGNEKNLASPPRS